MRYQECRRAGRYAGAAVCLAAALVFVVGCEEKASKKGVLTDDEIRRLTLAQEPDRPDRLIVCGETITWEDVLASLPEESTGAPLKERLENAAREMSQRQFLVEAQSIVQQRLNSRISNIVWSQRAERDLGEKKIEDRLNELAEKEVRRFILEEHGGNAAEADEALQKAGMNRASFKEWRKKQILVKFLVDSRYSSNRPITYGELQERYEGMKKEGRFVLEEVLQWRLIDIRVDRMDVGSPPEDSSLKARQLAEDLRKRIDAGEDFAELAKKYSHDSRAEEGGLWPARNPNAFAAPYDVLAARAMQMEPGQVAGPIAVPGRFFLMKVEEKKGRRYQPLSEVQEEVKRDIAEERWNAVRDELAAEVRRQVDLANTTAFVDYCLTRLYRQVHN
jgi:parvulin-like peptidyl-prolyl isomerase